MPGGRIAPWKVRQGITQVDAREFHDGTTATILAQEDDEPFELAPQENAKLLAAIEATRGEIDTAEQIVKNLRES